MRATSPCRTRVLWLSKGLGPGGLERLLVSFASLADHDRFAYRAAYLLPWKDHLVGDLAARGVPATCLEGANLGDPRWMWRLADLVRSERIDVVHVHSPIVGAVARPLLRALPGRIRPALVGTEHNVWVSHRGPTRWLNRATLPLQEVTFAVTDEVRRSMSPRSASRAETLVHGVDVEGISGRRDERARAREELGIADDELVAVIVANLRATKDYPTMLRAARHLLDKGVPARFLSVGQGPLDSELAYQRDQLGLADRFQFLGYRSDPVGVLVAADLFCLSSRHEGLPIALLEALAVGLPVAVTGVGGVPGVVRDGHEGYVVPPGDPVALAGGIARLADPIVRAERAVAAHARAQDYGVHQAVERQQEVYGELAARGPRASLRERGGSR